MFTISDFRWDAFVGPLNALRLVSWTKIMSASAVSSDGTFLVMSDLSSPETDYSTYIKRLDDSPPILLGSGYASLGSLSPDDQWVATIAASDLSQIRLLPVSVGDVKVVRARDFAYRSAAWTRDGKYLVVSASQGKRPYRTWLVSIGDGNFRAITPEGTTGRLVTLHERDYVAARHQSGALQLYPVNGGEPSAVKGVSPGDDVLGSDSASGSLYVTADSFVVPLVIDRVEVSSGRREPLASLVPADPAGVLRIENPLLLPGNKSWVFSQVYEPSQLYIVKGVR